MHCSMARTWLQGRAPQRVHRRPCFSGGCQPTLEEAFTGHFDDHHRFLLVRMLGRIDAIDADIADVDAVIEVHLALSIGRPNDSMRSLGSGRSRPRSSPPRSAST